MLEPLVKYFLICDVSHFEFAPPPPPPPYWYEIFNMTNSKYGHTMNKYDKITDTAN